MITTMKKPKIYIRPQSGSIIDWMSDGWGNDYKLMEKARDAIDAAKDYEEVIILLKKAGFDVYGWTEED